MKVSRPRRRNDGAMQADMSDLRALLADNRTHTAIGVVHAPELGAPHWRRSDRGDILVEVLIMPLGNQASARLSSAAGQVSAGLWRVPKVGTEVGILIPHGELDAGPVIVNTLSSGGAPARVSDSMTLLSAPDALELDAPAIRLGGEGANQKAMRGDDRVTDEGQMLQSLAAALTEIAAGLTAMGQSSAATTQAVTDVGLFRAKLQSHLSAVVKLR